MSWNFRITKKVISDTALYGITEVYYDESGDHFGWHENWRDPNGWEDLNDLKGTLTRMLQAFDREEFEPAEETLDDVVVRLKNEIEDLNQKQERLKSFLSSEKANDLDQKMVELLQKQAIVHTELLDVLKTRLDMMTDQ